MAALGLFACATPSADEEGKAAVETPSDAQDEERAQLAKEVREEVEVGRLMAAKLIGHVGLYEGPGAEHATRYLNLIGQTLAERAGRPEIGFRFAILKGEEINAFATPGGYVFLTEGLLRVVGSEAELAGVIGHEIAHVSEKHMYNEIRPKRSVTAGETVSRFLSRGTSELGVAISKVVNRGMQILLEEGLGKEKEGAADQAGCLFAAAAGYDGGALAVVLKRIRAAGKAVQVSKTHPPYDERIAALDRFLHENGLATGKKKSKRGSPALAERELNQRFVDAMAPFATRKGPG